MNLDEQIMKIIGPRWYVKKNPKIFLKDKDILRRGKCIKEVLTRLSKYKPKNEIKTKPLILDNLFGAAQHFLLGYDVSSIHHSSKSMEIGLLYKIGVPNDEERENYNEKSFWGIIEIVKQRGDLIGGNVIEAAERVHNRRNLFTHDAILQQTIAKVEEDWFRKKLQDANPQILEAIMLMFRKKFDDLHSLPDLSWYVHEKSLDLSVKLIVEFLENNIGRDLSPILRGRGLSPINRMKALKNIALSYFRQEYDFHRYSACANINDAYSVLAELYGPDFFDEA